jgi:predicted transcriptional regulator of viral defense system
MTRQEILKSLLIDEDAMLERLVSRSGKILKIDKSGNIIFLIPSSRLTHRQIIALVSLGHYFAAELGIREEDTVSADDFLPYLDTDKKTVTARLADLKKEGVVHTVERGRFRVSILGIGKILDEIESIEGNSR